VHQVDYIYKITATDLCMRQTYTMDGEILG